MFACAHLTRTKRPGGAGEPGSIAASATEYVAQHDPLRYAGAMPMATVRKVEALRADFRTGARLADMLGVSRSQITRWLRGAGIDPLNAEKVDLLELVWSNLLRLYPRDAALGARSI
jgi:hypothetical protein